MFKRGGNFEEYTTREILEALYEPWIDGPLPEEF